MAGFLAAALAAALVGLVGFAVMNRQRVREYSRAEINRLRNDATSRMVEGFRQRWRSHFSVAAASNDLKAVDFLLSDRRVRDADYALHISVAEGHSQVLERVLATVNPPPQKTLDHLLMFAASYGFADMVRTLIRHGADPSHASNSIAPICTASLGGHADVVALLLDNGARVDTADEQAIIVHPMRRASGVARCTGLTPLHDAVVSGCPRTVRLLLDRGAPVERRTRENLTPLGLCRQMISLSIDPADLPNNVRYSYHSVRSERLLRQRQAECNWPAVARILERAGATE